MQLGQAANISDDMSWDFEPDMLPDGPKIKNPCNLDILGLCPHGML